MHGGERLAAVGCFDRAVAETPQPTHQHVTVRGVVIDHEHGRHPGRAFSRGLRRAAAEAGADPGSSPAAAQGIDQRTEALTRGDKVTNVGLVGIVTEGCKVAGQRFEPRDEAGERFDARARDRRVRIDDACDDVEHLA